MTDKARKITVTDPRTGEVYTRTTRNDYTHVAVGRHGVTWHGTEAAARKRAGAYGRVVAIPRERVEVEATPVGRRTWNEKMAYGEVITGHEVAGGVMFRVTFRGRFFAAKTVDEVIAWMRTKVEEAR